MKLWPHDPSKAEMIFVTLTLPIRVLVWMLVLTFKETHGPRL